MFRTRIGLLAALLVVPAWSLSVMAKPARGGKKPAPTPTTTPAPTASAGGDASGAGAPGDGAPPDAASAGTTPPAAGGGDDSGADQTSPCAIDPEGDLCKQQKETDAKVAAAANRKVSGQMYAVQQIYVKRKYRVELNPYFAFTLNDQFVSHPGPGIALNVYLTNSFAIGGNFNWYKGLDQVSGFTADIRRTNQLVIPLNIYDYSAALNFTYVPIYGKFAGFGNFIFHYDFYVVGGAGIMVDQPIAVVNPDIRSFSPKLNVAGNLGLGLRIFFNRWLAATLELRDYAFDDQIENTALDKLTSTNPKDWTQDVGIVNNIQAQVGLSFFIPPTFSYYLPK